jgi:hypothetical protein
MPHFVVSYDLHYQRHYQPVWDLLESWGAIRLLESLWVVTRNSQPGTLREALKAVMDGDDSVAVIELGTGSQWATQNARQAGVQWLSRNIQNY